jgi:hypothetical protein
MEKVYNEIINSIHIQDSETIIIDCKDVVFKLSVKQRCCENRYFHTDDDLSSVKGGTLIKLEVLASNTTTKELDMGHDLTTSFLHIKTTKGDITIVVYNQHNGYYDQFELLINEIRK